MINSAHAAEEPLYARMHELCAEAVPLSGHGQTAERHARLIAVAREDLSLAKLVEAHWDAVAILAEAGRHPAADTVYAVWAAEVPGCSLALTQRAGSVCLSGRKGFASGAGIVDRALMTVDQPEPVLVEVDLRIAPETIHVDLSGWHTDAFAMTQTGTVTFSEMPAMADAIVGREGWYIERPGFWHGACGPAACWAGGALGLIDFARNHRRDDAHTLAHLGAMDANGWALETLLASAGREVDAAPLDRVQAMTRALRVRHLVEQLATDTLRRFTRAYGPAPLSMNAAVGRRVRELDLYLRQSHAERDLEALGKRVRGT